MTIVLLRWALVSTLAMAAVLALRGLTKNRISFRTRYVLWLLPLLRMLVPLFPGASAASAANLAPLSPLPSAKTALEGPASLHTWAAPTPSPAESAALFSWIPVLWAAGVAVALFCLLASNLLFQSRLTASRRPLQESSCPLPLYEAPTLASPLLLGLFRPAVYLPLGLEEKDKPYVLAHELAHWRHGDPLWSLLRGLALALHWYNPLAWFCLSLSRLDGELACDEGALAKLGSDKRLEYGRTLTDLADRQGERQVGGSAMTGKKAWLTLRVQALICQPQKRPSALFCSVAALILSAPLLFLGPRQTQSPPQQALEQLEQSLSYQAGGVTFTLPEGYQSPEDWNIHIAGRAVYPDGFSRSVHFFDSQNQAHTWQAGQRYMIAMDELSNCVELTMDIELPDGQGGQCRLSIDLLALSANKTKPAAATRGL